MATTWYARNSSVDIDSVNQWNDDKDGLGNWLTWGNLAVDDILCANNFDDIRIDVIFECDRISTAAEGTGAAGGYFTATGACTIQADIKAGTTPCLTTSGSGFTVYVIGNVDGGSAANARGIDNTNDVDFDIEGIVTGGSASSTYGVYNNNASNNVDIWSDVVGGSGAGGLYCNGACTIGIQGNVTGGSGSSTYGIYTGTDPTVTITGNVTGGSGSIAYGIYNYRSTISITGNVSGGSNLSASGVANISTGTTAITGNLINVASGGVALQGGNFTYTPGASNYTQWPTTGPSTITLYPPAAMANAKYVYNGIDRGDGTTGTLRASNIHSGAGAPGIDLSAGILESGVTVDDVTGTFTHTSDYVAKTDVIDSSYVLTGHDNYVGGDAGTLTLPSAAYIYNGIDRGDGTTGTLRASNIHTGAGAPGVDLAAASLKSGVTVDDVTGSNVGADFNTDPGIANVRDGTTYKILNVDLEGTLDLPVEANVKDGIFFDNATKEGSYPTTEDTQAADAAIVEAAKANIIAVADGGATILGVSGTGTLPAENVVDTIAGSYGVGGSSRSGALDLTDLTTDNLKSGVTINSVVGAFVGAGFNTNPGIANVRDGATYKSLNVDYEGTLDLPAEADVRDGTTFDGAGQEGSLDLPAEADVKKDVTFDGAGQTGTYVGAGFNTDPGVANVRDGTTYKILDEDKEGTYAGLDNDNPYRLIP